MARLLFEKTGRAVWISHLDLMRLFQRAFKRAGLALKHTQGYNPRPSVSIALPLSVGVESVCELLDFELEGDLPSMDAIRDGLNAALVDGVKVISVSHGGKKIKELAYLTCKVVLEYDNGVGEDAVEAICHLFAQPSVVVEKKGKNGPTEMDIIPMIRQLEVRLDADAICIDAKVCCQNPSLNPMLLAAAVTRYLPQYKADHVRTARVEVFDSQDKIFR